MNWRLLFKSSTMSGPEGKQCGALATTHACHTRPNVGAGHCSDRACASMPRLPQQRLSVECIRTTQAHPGPARTETDLLARHHLVAGVPFFAEPGRPLMGVGT